MRPKPLVALIALAVVTISVSWSPVLEAQGQSALVGAWERVSLKGADGAVTQPPALAAFPVLSADGFFSQTAVPVGRKKVDKPLD